jgi:hypothetical protein
VPSLALDELCTMLWDMIRYENYDETSPYNREAAAWARHQTFYRLPIDSRPLRDKLAGTVSMDELLPAASPKKPAKTGSSRGESPFRAQPAVRSTPVPTASPAASNDVLFIGDSDPIEAQVVPQPRRQPSGDDILFIE